MGTDGKAWLRNYGITVIDKIQFRDAFVFVGQRGLKQGSGIQKVSLNNYMINETERRCIIPILYFETTTVIYCSKFNKTGRNFVATNGLYQCCIVIYYYFYIFLVFGLT